MGRTYAVLDVHGGVETKKVTIESLAQRIAELERRPRSLNEDYQLEAYRELLDRLQSAAELVPVYQIEIYGSWCDTDEGEYMACDSDSRRILYMQQVAI